MIDWLLSEWNQTQRRSNLVMRQEYFVGLELDGVAEHSVCKVDTVKGVVLELKKVERHNETHVNEQVISEWLKTSLKS